MRKNNHAISCIKADIMIHLKQNGVMTRTATSQVSPVMGGLHRAPTGRWTTSPSPTTATSSRGCRMPRRTMTSPARSSTRGRTAHSTSTTATAHWSPTRAAASRTSHTTPTITRVGYTSPTAT